MHTEKRQMSSLSVDVLLLQLLLPSGKTSVNWVTLVLLVHMSVVMMRQSVSLHPSRDSVSSTLFFGSVLGIQMETVSNRITSYEHHLPETKF